MTQSQEFIVYGDPRGKGRPRFSFRGGYAYTDEVTLEYQGKVQKMWKSNQFYCIEGQPTEILIRAYFRVPVSLSKKKRAALFGTPYLHKPDCDNIAKIVLDALNGLAYQDDRQIDKLNIKKMYVSSDDEEPRVEITIRSEG